MRSSNHLALCHPCVTTTHLSYYSVLSLKLPPPFCAVLLAFKFFMVFQLRFKFYLQNLTWLCFVPFNRLKPSQLMSTVSQGSVARPFTFRFLGTAPFSVTVHMLRRNYESKHQLESQFADFDLDFVQLTCSNFTTFTVSRARPCQDMTSKILFDFRRATSLNSTIWDPPCLRQCSNESDRHFVHAAIVELYGSKEAFAEFVRGPLRSFVAMQIAWIYLRISNESNVATWS